MIRHMTSRRIGLIGDRNDDIVAHRAIPRALTLAAEATGIPVRFEWLPTKAITSPEPLTHLDGLWCLPGSPYQSMDGALWQEPVGVNTGVRPTAQLASHCPPQSE